MKSFYKRIVFDARCIFNPNLINKLLRNSTQQSYGSSIRNVEIQLYRESISFNPQLFDEQRVSQRKVREKKLKSI